MKRKIDQTIFRSYDIRGLYPQELDEDSASKIAKGYGSYLKDAKTIVVGRDIRKTSAKIVDSVIKGLVDTGKKVIDIGQVSTEMVYFAVNYLEADGGLALTASHNPAGWAGMKMVKELAIPLSSKTGIGEIQEIVNNQDFISPSKKGSVSQKNVLEPYQQKLLSLVDTNQIKPLKVVVNCLNGTAGLTIEGVLNKLPIELIKVDFNPEPNFPKGEPDPLLPKRRTETTKIIREKKADLGASFDGDGDRCLFFDSKGQFIKGSYIVALLAKHLLDRSDNKEKIITDCRLYWPAQEVVKKGNGKLIIKRPGHTFLKQAMRDNQALFAGEISGHFYYKDFYYADSGLLTLLYLLEMVSSKNQPVRKMVKPLADKYPASDEINFIAQNKQEIINQAKQTYSKNGEVEEIDGIGVDLDSWRFNLRASGTEPKIRLNLEAKKRNILNKKQQELIAFVIKNGGKLA